MIAGIAKSLLIGSARRRLHAPPVGPVTGALLTAGLSLALTRGRRPLGMALAVAGGLLLWRQVEHQDHASAVSPPAPAAPPPAPADGAGAKAPR